MRRQTDGSGIKNGGKNAEKINCTVRRQTDGSGIKNGGKNAEKINCTVRRQTDGSGIKKNRKNKIKNRVCRLLCGAPGCFDKVRISVLLCKISREELLRTVFFGRAEYLFGSALLLDVAAVHEYNLIGNITGECHFVCYDYHCKSLCRK